MALAPFTTLGVGGAARCFVEALSEDEIIAALGYGREHGLNIFILGGGSNLLVSDDGFDGLVIKVDIFGVQFQFGEEHKVLVSAGAGEEWDDLVSVCVDLDLAGLECLSGIPGKVGGTPVQNVGAYGQDVSETIVSVRCIDRETCEIIDLNADECRFGYRSRIFNTAARDRYVVTSVNFLLEQNGKPKVEYRDLVQRFDKEDPTLSEVRKAVLAIRSSKSMVIDPLDPDSRSAGSFFKNPVISLERFDELRSQWPAIPSFPAGDGSVKVPAAWLIENAGFAKGTRRGKAGISTKHTLALVNLGGAAAADIICLRDEIRQKVVEIFAIELMQEPVFLAS